MNKGLEIIEAMRLYRMPLEQVTAVIHRQSRGLCPELAIYWRGTKEGELAWYILGISEERDYFWCNGEVFYKQ